MSPNFQSKHWETVKVSIAVIQSCIALGCLLFAFYVLCINPKRKSSRPKWIPCCTILGLICFVMSPVFLACSYMTTHISHWYFIKIAEIRLALFCWSFGHFFSYFVFLLRLIDTFSNSSYRVSRETIILSVILLILYEISWIIKCAAPFLLWNDIRSDDDFSHSKIRRFLVYISIPILFLDVLITVAMTYMFISRLIIVMGGSVGGQIVDIHDPRSRMDALDESLSVEGTNQKMMNLSIKVAVLSITSLFSSLLFVSVGAMGIYFDFGGIMLLLTYLGLQIETLITCFCVTLFLGRAMRVYHTLCCCCIAVGYRCMKPALLREVKEQSTLSTLSKSTRSIGIFDGMSKSQSFKTKVNSRSSEPILMSYAPEVIHE